ncbi:MAG: M20/M25/M40 family metallo-hydrolase [Rhodospirillaceae bacterium]|nr:M20/M25/M40 family metallo-hydrolase [Rhodospirillaceae bacterium]
MKTSTRLLLCGLALAAGTAQAASAKRDDKVWSAVEAARPAQLKLLEQLVNIDSGTGDVEGSNKIQGILTADLKALGMTVESIPAEAPNLGANTVATLTGSGKTRILMIAHTDTVYEAGTAKLRPYRTDETHAYGPGVADEKGGVVQGLYALKILHDLKFTNFAKITYLIETSEERGSPGTRKLIDKLLSEADVELNLEGGDEPDVLTVWRKGSSTFHIDVKGRPAHAGVAPQDGRNAAMELIHQLAGIESLPKSGEGLTANLTVMSAGTRNNIIPENASAQVNVRVRNKASLDEVEALLKKNAETTVIPDTKVTVSREAAYPPLVNNPATDKLAARAQRIYAEIGKTIGTGGNGGASESALAADANVPALDGLGPVGANFHSEKEYMVLATVSPRLYLLTRMLMDLGPTPPPKN